jgi:transposase
MPGLIDYPAQIWVAVAPVDMRRGLDGLSAIVQQSLGHSPCAGSAFIFRNRVGNRLRLLLWDGNGVWLCQRRLHQGGFVWPKVGDAVFAMTQRSGIGWLPVSIGSDYRLSRKRNGGFERASKLSRKKPLKLSHIKAFSG